MAVGKSKQPDSEKPCFLIVDSDHQSVISVSNMLESFGLRVDAANCGSAAFNCLDENWYDVIIADSEMTDSNGYDFFQRVKDNFPKIRTVIMTGQNCSEIGRHIKRTNADNCITKPISMNNLKSVLNDICQFPQPPEQKPSRVIHDKKAIQ